MDGLRAFESVRNRRRFRRCEVVRRFSWLDLRVMKWNDGPPLQERRLLVASQYSRLIGIIR